jgi:ribonuclease-3
MPPRRTKLKDLLEHSFSEASLIAAALTHPSVDAGESYQRLEFLGDRVLGLVIATKLYDRYGEAPEGELATRYNALVRRETLAEIAAENGLASHIRLSRSEEESGGREKPAILADVLEAVIGAMYLDAGMEAASALILRWWAPFIEDQKAAPKDAKTELQEWAQARGMATPAYREVSRDGPPHAPIFTMAVSVGRDMGAEGVGRSKQVAEQAAAKKLLVLALREGAA